MDNSLLEASADLGASPAQTFKRVTLPLSVPGIINGITLVFLPAVSSFFIPKALGGGQYFLIGNMIENQFITVGEWNFGSAISMIMAVIMMVLMMVVRKIEIRNQGGKGGIIVMNKGKRPIGKILMILSVVFFYLPILYMIIFSFNDGKSLTSFTGFSPRWYKHMLESADMMDALSTTFSIAPLATFISTVAGTIAAIGVSKSKKLIRDLMEQANNLPIMNPEIVTAIGFMLLFITFHVEKGYVTMLLAHIAFCIPYVMLSVMPKIKSLDPNLADARWT